jgi:hypothetical protein
MLPIGCAGLRRFQDVLQAAAYEPEASLCVAAAVAGCADLPMSAMHP